MNNIRRLREAAGLNMREAAASLDIPYTTYVNYEKGEREPNSEMLIKIAEYFGTSIDYLLGRTDRAAEKYGFCYRWEDLGAKKSHAYDVLQSTSPPEAKEAAAIELLKVYFSRSLGQNGYSLKHPDFNSYAAMLLNQNQFKRRFGEKIYSKLVDLYGKKPGIPEGSTTYRISDLPDYKFSEINDFITNKKFSSISDETLKVTRKTGKLSDHALHVGYMYDIAAPRDQKIVDTALEPYAEYIDESLRRGSQFDASASAPKPKRTDQLVRYYPTAKVIRRKDDFDELTVFEEAAAAGLGNYLSDTPVTHIEQYPSGMIPAGTNYGVPISGDSMTPKFKDGSTAFVQSTPVINAGEIGIFALNGNSYIKQLIIDRENGTVHLHSLNPNYEDIIVSESDTLYTFGRVLGSYPE